MSSKKEPTEKRIINTRSRTRQRAVSFDSHRICFNNRSASPAQIQFRRNLFETSEEPITVVSAGVPDINTCRALIPYMSLASFIANILRKSKKLQLNPIVQNISVPIEIFHQLEFNISSFLIPGIKLQGVQFDQFIIKQFDQEYIFTNRPFVKRQLDSNFAFVRPIEYTVSEKMAPSFNVKDLVSAIPSYNGDENQLETFLNVCKKFYSLIEENQRDNFVSKL